MKLSNNRQGYSSPQTEVIYIMTESVLCQSDSFGVTLEDMKENDYTFTF